jgi:hypothetical protein
MTTGIAPNTSFQASVFYDADNNPLNIPCEGPRLIQVQLDPSFDDQYIIDFSNIQQQGQFSQLQSCFLDISDYAQGELSGGLIGMNAEIVVSGSNQRIFYGNVSDYGNGQDQIYNSGAYFPLIACNPPRVTVNFDFISESPPTGSMIRLTFFNFMVPPANFTMI